MSAQTTGWLSVDDSQPDEGEVVWLTGVTETTGERFYTDALYSNETYLLFDLFTDDYAAVCIGADFWQRITQPEAAA